MTDLLDKIEKNTAILVDLERSLSRIEKAIVAKRLRVYDAKTTDRRVVAVATRTARTAKKDTPYRQTAPAGKNLRSAKQTPNQDRPGEPKQTTKPVWQQPRAVEPKSVVRQQEVKELRRDEKQNRSLAGVLGKTVGKIGSGLSGVLSNRNEDALDAAGLATSGPIWSAIREAANAVDVSRDNRFAKSAVGFLKKKFGGPESHNGRDAKGRFLKSKKDPTVEAIVSVRQTLEGNEKKEVKRHRKLLREVDDIDNAQAGGGGGGGPSMLEGLGALQVLKTGGVGALLGSLGGKVLGKIPGGKFVAGGIGKLLGKVGPAAKLGAAAARGGLIGKVAGVGGKVLGVGSRSMGALAAPLTGLLSFLGKRKELDERRDLTEKQKTTRAAAVGIGAGGGALGGAGLGAASGAAIGSVVPVLGTAVGGVVGAIIGGIAGAWGGERLGDAVGKAVSDTMDEAEERAAKMLDERESIIEREGRRVWYKPSTWFGGKKGGADYKPDPDIVTGKNLGRVSEKYESGGRGVGTVSSGVGDAGGVSYGKHQLASKTGTMDLFLNSKEAAAYADRFKGLKPGTAAFNQAYKQTAESDPEGFAKAQHDFIKRSHFDPVAAYAKVKGLDVNDPAIQEALWSQSVQHSGKGNRQIIDAAVARAGQGASTTEVVNALYDARSDYAGQYASAAATAGRYAKERKDVLAIAANKDLKKPLQTAAIDGKMRTADGQQASQMPPVREIAPPQQEAQPQSGGQPASRTANGGREREPIRRGEAGKTESQIPTEYDDTLLALMAVDRI